ncbi:MULTISPECIES: SDR family NAD(P)-dependent oxidoreductase [unclassified Oceanispirochaeta]|uniref:SDR family NAD(P)-dependent oxidoreductase n=1 Tax=unclassified Oceanispirochaeta TaxID=2635722 RepID=UPI000E08DA85|nr:MULTISPECIES: SDR family NAD(P)-dependent oxidoreductase [unclassified Oceanispirochaeta]MBF9017371.1 SDR family NAD(P)-dependent oxidoreductase [Oceanispirochaeta sp. M2]NPD73746.1 SDR family NAD(P)-dependent oxidoreductase [Oceanispirochaeta sp. M1]RDG30498.1 SDR family NAD(P)-dependent oxidoreductase [Oceanispirochaeta sp. M1]
MINSIMETIVISGATSGIGWASFKALAEKGYRVIGIGRSREKIEQCLIEMEAAGKRDQAEYILADLSSQREIHRASREIETLLNGDDLYCLINNAGSFASNYKETVDGIEWQLAINHMAPFLLSRLLIPFMKEGSRIVTVSSRAHRGAKLHWKDPGMKRLYSSLGSYRQSKFFNVLTMNEINRRYKDKKITACCADPGLVNTDIGLKGTKGLSKLVWYFRSKQGQSVEDGASTSVFLASEPDLDIDETCYFKYCKALAPDSRTANIDFMEKLWDLSETYLIEV